ncbi:methylated-DNA--[protein]-cysteine S-methyltransferase [Geomonas sp.]|uniref:methylated-DNA--[protein]-cysteine S-methyltransferase n=1 Tax=Geomonas sp. TaxID=2651584 RepID=UPI002B4706CE|nr:methylated-DNA--[protein]-cysteine S-methyltransferase [Geomonas sp.]
MIYKCTIETPLGPMTAAAEDEVLVGLWFDGQKYFPAGSDGWSEAPDLPVFAALRKQLQDYFAGTPSPILTHLRPKATAGKLLSLPLKGSEGQGDGSGVELSLAPKGTEFQKAVWEALSRIPFGKTVTYGDIAREIAATRGLTSMSAQAVGSAVGHNPISILIPCHRVVGCNGKLTGYAGGLDRKEALLRLEASTLPD